VNGEWIRDETEARGQWGICQDDQGRLFYNYNHSQLFADFVPPNSFSRNPHHEPTTGWNVSVTMSNEVFPIRPNLATNRGYIPGALDEQDRIQQFTSACAPFIYRENIFPEFTGNAFVCETAGNLVKRNVLTNNGISVTGAPAYGDRDFLASKDERFRPCWIETGPDGAIYIADMYRGIVQDAPHMSPYLREISLKRKMVKPIHLGRIWRIVPEAFSQPKAPAFPDKTTDELVALLDHESGWWRDQAQTHLVEQGLDEAVPLLIKTLREGKTELGRLHALWTLEGLGYEEGEKTLFTLRDSSALVRSAAIRVLPAIEVPAKKVADAIESQVGNSASPEEVLQAVITLGDLKIRTERRHQLLADIVISRASDPILRDAALSSLAGQEVAFLSHVWDQLGKEKTDSPGWDFLIESLAAAGLKGKDSRDCDQLLAKLGDKNADWKEAALRNSIHALRNDLVAEPIALSTKPVAASTFEELAHYFSWPGHTPEPPTLAGVRPLKKSERERFARGRQIYLTSCVACHGTDGKGMKFLAPPLAESDWVNGSDERLVRVLLHGLSGPITVNEKRYEAPEIQPVMPPLAGLGNSEIAAVLTYIRREWGNTSDPISSKRVSKIRISSQGRTIPWTEEELNKISHVFNP
jgi:mono/diheme cytochrome c family protein